MLIGSVTAGVVRRASRPVLLCGPRYAPERHGRVEVVMACVDGSSLSEAMLPHAVALAERFGARLQLLQVIDAIVSYLADSRDVMLTMTTHGRSGLSQVAAGSVSHEVLHEACCPVAVLRPKG